MGPFRIRLIEERDDAAVERVIRFCLKEFGADHPGTAWMDPDLGHFSRVYSLPGRRYWVAESQDGVILGGVGIGELPGEESVCELQKMYCLPAARGVGIAQALLDGALSFAARHYRQCYLETLDNMAAAHRFYEKNGFRRINHPLGSTGHTACDILYLKDL